MCLSVLMTERKRKKGDMKKLLEVMDASTTLMVLMAQVAAYVQIHNPERTLLHAHPQPQRRF